MAKMGSILDKLGRCTVCKKDVFEDELLEQVEGFLEGKGVKAKSIDFVDDSEHIAVKTEDGDYRVLEINCGNNKTEIIGVTKS